MSCPDRWLNETIFPSRPLGELLDEEGLAFDVDVAALERALDRRERGGES